MGLEDGSPRRTGPTTWRASERSVRGGLGGSVAPKQPQQLLFGPLALRRCSVCFPEAAAAAAGAQPPQPNLLGLRRTRPPAAALPIGGEQQGHALIGRLCSSKSRCCVSRAGRRKQIRNEKSCIFCRYTVENGFLDGDILYSTFDRMRKRAGVPQKHNIFIHLGSKVTPQSYSATETVQI